MFRKISLAALLIALVSCSDTQDTLKQEQVSQERPGQARPGQARPDQTQSDQANPDTASTIVQQSQQAPQTTRLPVRQGRVVSQISVPGYTYLEVENDGQRLWVAGTPIEVDDGDVAAWDKVSIMTNFRSKTLNRTFDRILFAGRIYKPSDGVARVSSAASSWTASAASAGNRGRVVSAQNAANYSYLEIEVDSGSTLWIAAPETQVAANDMVTWQDGSMMQNFTSKSLQRTFPEILFVGQVTVER